MKRKTSEPKVSKWIPLWKNYHGKGYISPVIKTSDFKALEQGTSNKASFKAVKVK